MSREEDTAAALDAAVKAMLADINSDVRKDLRHYGQAFIKISPDGQATRVNPADIQSLERLQALQSSYQPLTPPRILP